MPKISLGSMLKEARSQKTLTIADVAARAKCSVGYVHKLESDGVQNPSPKVLQRLSSALEIPYDRMTAATGYLPPATEKKAPPSPVAGQSNADIAQLLRQILAELSVIKAALQLGDAGAR